MSDFDKRLQSFIRANCSAFCAPDGCLREPYGEPICKYFYSTPWRYDRCMWAERAVIPADPMLETEYWAVLTGNRSQAVENIDKCSRCGERFVKRSNRHQYCDRCAAIRKRDSDRESKRKQRENVRN